MNNTIIEAYKELATLKASVLDTCLRLKGASHSVNTDELMQQARSQKQALIKAQDEYMTALGNCRGCRA